MMKDTIKMNLDRRHARNALQVTGADQSQSLAATALPDTTHHSMVFLIHLATYLAKSAWVVTSAQLARTCSLARKELSLSQAKLSAQNAQLDTTAPMKLRCQFLAPPQKNAKEATRRIRIDLTQNKAY